MAEADEKYAPSHLRNAVIRNVYQTGDHIISELIAVASAIGMVLL